jgi:hypothetical protein
MHLFDQNITQTHLTMSSQLAVWKFSKTPYFIYKNTRKMNQQIIIIFTQRCFFCGEILQRLTSKIMKNIL